MNHNRPVYLIRKIEWIRLYELHPDLFQEAIEIEKFSMELRELADRDYEFSLAGGEKLSEIISSDRILEIKKENRISEERNVENSKLQRLIDIFPLVTEEIITKS